MLVDSCANHPGRRGFAVCMSCSKVVCQECATTWDGVNHCRSCLARRRAATASRGQLKAWIAWAAFCVLAAFLTARAIAWSAAMAARIF